MNNDWLDIELLEDYLDGKLDSKAMHKIEKQALEDPFVAQALAGLSESPGRAVHSVSLLQKQLYERIAQHQETKKETVFTWQRLSVAAAAAVMFISVSIMFFMKDREKREQMAKNHPRKVEVNIAPAPAVIDSAKNDIYAANIPAVSKKQKTVIPGQISPAREKLQEVVMDKAVQSYAVQSAPVIVAADSSATPVSRVLMGKVAGIRSKTAVATAIPVVSAPIGGWANFDSYLNDHNKLTGHTGTFVELSFLIDQEGKPADIKIIRGAAKEFEDEAVRLIKEGPKWEQPKLPESRMIYTIAF